MVSNVLDMYTQWNNLDSRDKDYKVKMRSTLEMLKDILPLENLSPTINDDLPCTTSSYYVLISKCQEKSMNNNNEVSETTVPQNVHDCVALDSSDKDRAKFYLISVPNSRELYVMIKKRHPKLYGFSDPHNHIPEFLTTAWDSTLFNGIKFDEYPRYLHIPYIHLLLHYRESIDLTIMLEPPSAVLEEA